MDTKITMTTDRLGNRVFRLHSGAHPAPNSAGLYMLWSGGPEDERLSQILYPEDHVPQSPAVPEGVVMFGHTADLEAEFEGIGYLQFLSRRLDGSLYILPTGATESEREEIVQALREANPSVV